MMKTRLPILVALTLSGGLHAAGAIVLGPQSPEIEVEGGTTATVGLLGEAFEDLAQGAVPVSASSAAPAAALSPTPPVAAVAPPAPLASVAPSPALPSAVPPSGATADLPAATAQSAPPVLPSPSAPVPPTTAATAIDPAAPETSPRPVRRAEARKETPRPQRTEVATQEVATQAGNADRSARKGTSSGQDRAANAATGAERSSAPATTAEGNAARSTYPGLVLRKIERTRKPSVSARGTVIVSFRVSASGALATARIVRSSGDASLERAALDHIKRAAPFPAPPAGAETEFRFEFVGRR